MYVMYNIKYTGYRYVCDNKFRMVVHSGGGREMGLEGGPQGALAFSVTFHVLG